MPPGGVHGFTDHGEMRTLKLRKQGPATQTFTGPATATKGIALCSVFENPLLPHTLFW